MRRVPQLDGLRGVAILMVFAYHSLGVPLLWSGVDLFFVLSGYLITGVLLRLKEEGTAGDQLKAKYYRSFYGRRAVRILPPYFLFLLIIGLCFSVPWSRTWCWYIFFAANIAVITNHIATSAMLPLWSLAVEEQFYLTWPFVVHAVSPKTLKKIALMVIVAAPVLRALTTPFLLSRWPIYTLPFFRADTLAWGALIAAAEYEKASWTKVHRSLGRTCAIAAGVLIGALSAFHSFRLTANSVFFNTLGYSLIDVMFAGILIFVIAAQHGVIYRALRTRILRHIGKTSYTFYLYHMAILLLIQRNFHSLSLSCLLAFLGTSSIATASWFGFESPLLTGSLWNSWGRLTNVPIRRAGSGR